MQQPLLRQKIIATPKTILATEGAGIVPIPANVPRWRKALAFSGPGLLVAVGYMDPGNWATDIAGGSRYEYRLLFVILLSNCMAVVMQSLATRLGIVTGQDLAQACRSNYSRPVTFGLWVLCEIAIAACDLAEVIGGAIALQLLFGLPLMWGVCLTAFDVLLILWLQNRGFRFIEVVVGILIITIAACFAVEMFLAQPQWHNIAGGFVPTAQLFRDPNMLYLAVGVLGATVMPHNLYLHSSIVKTRAIQRTPQGVREAIKYNLVDSTTALTLAFVINSMILILGAAVFYRAGRTDIAEIQDAHQILAPLLGTPVAAVLFAVALLCSGQSATLTSTMAGQIVIEGFINLRMRPWVRRLFTRLVAIIPAIIITAFFAEDGTAKLLILSQVILSLQLPFAVFPLIAFTSNPKIMGTFVNPPLLRLTAWVVGIIIALLNSWLLIKVIGGTFG